MKEEHRDRPSHHSAGRGVGEVCQRGLTCTKGTRPRRAGFPHSWLLQAARVARVSRGRLRYGRSLSWPPHPLLPETCKDWLCVGHAYLGTVAQGQKGQGTREPRRGLTTPSHSLWSEGQGGGCPKLADSGGERCQCGMWAPVRSGRQKPPATAGTAKRVLRLKHEQNPEQPGPCESDSCLRSPPCAHPSLRP